MQKLLADKNYGDLMIILVAVMNQFNGTGCLDNSPLKEFVESRKAKDKKISFFGKNKKMSFMLSREELKQMIMQIK